MINYEGLDDHFFVALTEDTFFVDHRPLHLHISTGSFMVTSSKKRDAIFHIPWIHFDTTRQPRELSRAAWFISSTSWHAEVGTLARVLDAVVIESS